MRFILSLLIAVVSIHCWRIGQTPSATPPTVGRTVHKYNVKQLNSNSSTWPQDLLAGYDRALTIGPMPNRKAIVNIYVYVLQVFSVDLFKELVSIHVWYSLQWTDPKLVYKVNDVPSWNSDEDVIIIHEDDIWTPDVEATSNLNNLFDTPDVQVFDEVFLAQHGYNVEWWRKGNIKWPCPMNIENYPFDTQHCPLQFASWAYPASQLSLDTSWQPGAGNLNTEAEYNFTWRMIPPQDNSSLYEGHRPDFVWPQNVSLTSNPKRLTHFLDGTPDILLPDPSDRHSIPNITKNCTYATCEDIGPFVPENNDDVLGVSSYMFKWDKVPPSGNTSRGYPYIEFVLTVERQPYYFFIHVISPTIFVVMLSAVLNFVDPARTDIGSARVMTTFVLLLITISYPTFTYQVRPAVKTDTWLDSFIAWSMYMLFWPILQSILAIWFAILEDRNDDGKIVSWINMSLMDFDRGAALGYH